MKVIQVCPFYYPDIGGVQFHVKLLSEHLAKKGVDVEVCTTTPKKQGTKNEIINNVKITRLHSIDPNSTYNLAPSVLSFLQKSDADIIHAHSIHSLPMLFAASAKRRNGVPLVSNFYFHGKAHTFFRDLLFKPYRSLFGEYVLRKTDLLLCLSECEKVMIQSIFRTSVRTKVIEAGLRFQPPEYLQKNNEVKKKITFVGRLEEYKGVQYLLIAFSKVIKEVDAQLFIFGEGPYESQLRILARKLQIMENVTFSKKKGDEIILEYCTSDVVVLPSRQESFNLVAIEALSCGTPVITTPIGEAEVLIKNRFCVGLQNPSDANEIYLKILSVLNNNSRSASAKQEITKKYSYGRIADLTLREYKSLCA
jgi:glycosyltransferase involved in cell wall biosynthesis